jgi:thioredoxin 1
MEFVILYRLVWASLIVLAGVAVYALLNHWLLQRGRAQVFRLKNLQSGSPAILYFTTPDCAPCKTIQRPALQSVREQLGENLQIIEVDAYEEPEMAAAWKVLSVPTTFILDAQGHPRHVNHGVTPAPKLIQQLEAIGRE